MCNTEGVQISPYIAKEMFNLDALTVSVAFFSDEAARNGHCSWCLDAGL